MDVDPCTSAVTLVDGTPSMLRRENGYGEWMARMVARLAVRAGRATPRTNAMSVESSGSLKDDADSAQSRHTVPSTASTASTASTPARAPVSQHIDRVIEMIHARGHAHPNETRPLRLSNRPEGVMLSPAPTVVAHTSPRPRSIRLVFSKRSRIDTNTPQPRMAPLTSLEAYSVGGNPSRPLRKQAVPTQLTVVARQRQHFVWWRTKVSHVFCVVVAKGAESEGGGGT